MQNPATTQLTAKEFRRYLIPLLVTVFVDTLGIGIVLPIAEPLLLHPEYNMLPNSYDAGTRTLVYGFLIASFTFAQFFGAPILGSWADKFGRKKLLMLSLSGIGLGYFLFSLGVYQHSITLCFASRLFAGFLAGNVAIAYSAISDITTEKNRTKTFALIGMCFGAGFIVGPFVGGKLSDPSIVSWFSITTPYAFAGILTFLNVLGISIYLKETLRVMKNTKTNLLEGFSNIKKAMQHAHLNGMFVGVFIFSLALASFQSFWQPYLDVTFHCSNSEIGTMFGYVGIWIVFTQGVLTRFLSKKYQPHIILRFAPIGLGIAYLLLLVPTQMATLYFILPLVAIFQGFTMPNILSYLSLRTGAGEQGAILGISQSMMSLGMIIVPILQAFLASHFNMSIPLITGAAFAIIACLVFRKEAKATI